MQLMRSSHYFEFSVFTRDVKLMRVSTMCTAQFTIGLIKFPSGNVVNVFKKYFEEFLNIMVVNKQCG